MSKKHIVFVIRNFNYGGVERQTTNLGNEFIKRGYKVTLLVTNELCEDIGDWKDDRIELIQCDSFTASEPELSDRASVWAERQRKNAKRLRYLTKKMPAADYKLKRYVSVIRDCSSLRCFLLKNTGAVFIAFNIPIYEKLTYASKGLNVHLIYAETISPVKKESADKQKIKEEIVWPLLKKADACIFQTNWQKNYYRKYVKGSKSYVIYNPVKNDLPERYTGERNKTIVTFCRYAVEKNLFLLTDAFELFLRSHPEYALVIYGVCEFDDEKKYYDELTGHIAELQCRERIHLLPAVSNVHEKIRDCAMFVSSSDSEGLSNSMLEALSIGLPCICTDCEGGSAAEMIQNGENGLLVPMRDPIALSNAMTCFAENAAFAEKCGIASSGLTRTLHVDKIAEQWLSVIERIYRV